MKSIFSQRRTRCIATVMAFIWLMTIGVSIGNACVIDLAQGHHSISTPIQASQDNASGLQPKTADKLACLEFCADEQNIAVKVKQLDAATGTHLVSAIWLSAITVTVVDPNDRPAPAVIHLAHEPPVSIRFLRLTI
jgi:hypothetical protein